MQCLRCVDAPNPTRGYPHLGKNMTFYASKFEFLLPQIQMILIIWSTSSSELSNSSSVQKLHSTTASKGKYISIQISSTHASNSSLRPLPNRKLTITHIPQFPIFCSHFCLRPYILHSPRRTRYKTSWNEMIIRPMRIPIPWQLHQHTYRPPQSRSTILQHRILKLLPEIHQGTFRRTRHGKIVSVHKHLCPVIPVEVVDCATCAYEQDFLFFMPQR